MYGKTYLEEFPMPTTIELIKQLREETGAGVLDCRLALEQADASYTAALATLREKAQASAARRTKHAADQGMLEVYAHGGGRVAVMLEVSCETDFAARSSTLRSFAHELALHIAASEPLWVSDSDIPAEVIAAESEKAAAKAQAENKPAQLLPRIIAGSLDKYRSRTVLLRQVSIRDETRTIQELLTQTAAVVGENILIRRFVRWERGN
jgi:elongation factor Ts